MFWRFFHLFQLTFFFSLFNEAGFREEFENVLTPIAILSADIFATSRSVIKREAATPVLSASSVILSYMITTVSETNIKKFLNPLSALSTGSQSLDSKEKNVAVEALKEAKVFPPGNLDYNTKCCSQTCTRPAQLFVFLACFHLTNILEMKNSVLCLLKTKWLVCNFGLASFHQPLCF